MTDVFGFLFYRGIERWMIVLGGLIFGYLGYKLFLYGVDQGHGKLNAENQFFKITFSGSGPGLFFMVFGALILMSSVYSTGTVTRTALLGDTAQQSASAGSASNMQAGTETTFKYASVIGASDCNNIRLDGHDSVSDALEAYKNVNDPRLNTLGASLNRLEGEDLKAILLAIEKVICE